jgi:hypothetical protein
MINKIIHNEMSETFQGVNELRIMSGDPAQIIAVINATDHDVFDLRKKYNIQITRTSIPMDITESERGLPPEK